MKSSFLFRHLLVPAFPFALAGPGAAVAHMPYPTKSIASSFPGQAEAWRVNRA